MKKIRRSNVKDKIIEEIKNIPNISEIIKAETSIVEINDKSIIRKHTICFYSEEYINTEIFKLRCN